jgi:hypothetical protein
MIQHTIEIKDYSAEAWLGAAMQCLEEINAPKDAFGSEFSVVQRDIEKLYDWAKEEGL